MTSEEEELRAKSLAFRSTGSHEDACSGFEELVAMSPTNAVYWTDLGLSYLDLSRTQDASEAFKRGIQVAPGYPSAFYNLGNISLDESVRLHNSGIASRADVAQEADRAIAYFRECLDSDAKYAACHYNLALAYRMASRPKEAGHHMTIALRLDPSFTLPDGFRMQRDQF